MTSGPYVRQSPSCSPRTRTWRKTFTACLTLALSATFGLASSPPVGADAVLNVSPRDGLNPDGAFVSVSGTGYVPNSQLFVMQCRAASAEEHICNSVGLRKVTTDANGSFNANAMRLVARFGATDCLRSSCAVMTSAVSGHSDNRSQDRRTPISFAQPAPPATQPPPPQTQPAPPQTQPGAVAPAPGPAPATPGPDQVAGSTTPPVDTTSSAPSTSEAAASTTEASRQAQGEPDDGEAVALAANGTAAGELSASDGDGDGDGGSNTALLIGVGVVLAAAAGGGAFVLARRRGASA